MSLAEVSSAATAVVAPMRDTSIMSLQYDHAPPHPHPILDLAEAALVAQQRMARGDSTTTPSSSAPSTPQAVAQQPQHAPPPAMDLESEAGGSDASAPKTKSRSASSFLSSAFKKATALKEAAGRKVDEVRSHAHTAVKNISKAREVESFQKQFPSVVVAGAGLLSSHRCRALSNGVPVPGILYLTTHALCFISDAAASGDVASQPTAATAAVSTAIDSVGAVIHDVIPLELIASVIPSVALQTYADAARDFVSFPQLEQQQQQQRGDRSADGPAGDESAPAPTKTPPLVEFGPLFVMPVPAASVVPNAISLFTWGNSTHESGTQKAAVPPHVLQFVDFTDSFVQELITSNEAVLAPDGAQGALSPTAMTKTTDHTSERVVAATLLKLRNPVIRALYGIDRAWTKRLQVPTVAASLANLRCGAVYAPVHF